MRRAYETSSRAGGACALGMELATPSKNVGQDMSTLLATFDKMDADGDGKLDLGREIKDWLPMNPEAPVGAHFAHLGTADDDLCSLICLPCCRP